MNDEDILKQMMAYCNETQNYSYYDLMFYAEDSRPDWAAVLRKKRPRSVMAQYLRDARRECRAKEIPQLTLY